MRFIKKYYPFLLLIGLAIILSFWASSKPDALESVLEEHQITGKPSPSLLEDYSLEGISNLVLNNLLTIMLGVFVLVGLIYIFAKWVSVK